MRKIVGLVCEGPRDRELLQDLISMFFPEDDIDYRYLQPEPSLNSRNSNGWKGVLRWCRKDYPRFKNANSALMACVDLLVIQMDGDVSREESNKKSHCICMGDFCLEQERCKCGELICAEECVVENNQCPIQLPCNHHGDSKPQCYVSHLRNLINNYLGDMETVPIVITIPCDSTDAWIVAAFESELLDYEILEKPWENIIARKKEYHGIRIKNRAKSKAVYRELSKGLIENWELVRNRCSQAEIFNQDMETSWSSFK